MWPVAGLASSRGKGGHMAGEDWRRLADYVVARRVELGMRDRRAFAEATGVTERTLGKLENGQRVSPSTLGMVENRLGWAPGSCRRILAGGEPNAGSADLGHAEYEDPTLWHIASTPGLPPDVVRGLVALALGVLDQAMILEKDESCVERALGRVMDRKRPSHKNYIKDSIHWEHYLELSRRLVAADHSHASCGDCSIRVT